jgi:dihydroorotase
MLGFETALPLALELVGKGALPLSRAVELLTAAPARAFSLAAGRLAVGGAADVVVVDPERRWTVDRARVRSKSHNTPFHGRAVRGCAVLTVVGGKLLHDLDKRLS